MIAHHDPKLHAYGRLPEGFQVGPVEACCNCTMLVAFHEWRERRPSAAGREGERISRP